METVIELGIAFMCVSFNNMMTFCCNNRTEDELVNLWGVICPSSSEEARQGAVSELARVMANKSVMKLVRRCLGYPLPPTSSGVPMAILIFGYFVMWCPPAHILSMSISARFL